eukprot:gene10819-13255_t
MSSGSNSWSGIGTISQINNNSNSNTNNTNTIVPSNHQFINNDDWDNIFQDENGEDGEQLDQSYRYHDYSMRDSIVFLIDCSKSMFEKNNDGEIPFHMAIKCLIQTITDKIITSESDLIGLCLYNTDKKKNINDFDNIYVLFDLDVPDPKIILTLEEILESDFSKSFGHCDKEFPFCDALWTCSTMFSNCTVKVSHKRIFLFTNEDNPNGFNENLRTISFQRAKDLTDLGIQIELFSMNRLDERFDFTLFYQYILLFDDNDYIDPQQFDASTKFSELRNKLKRKEFKKRSLGKIPLYIGQGNQIIIATQLYNLIGTSHKSSPTQLDPKTNLPVKILTKNVCLDTGSTLLPSQIKYCYYYGGEPIILSKDEMEQIRSIDRQGIVLLGFKPVETVKAHRSIKHASFLFPDEASVKGSTVAFNSLLEQMIKSNKVAICRFTPRGNASPRIVALLPQEEVLDNNENNIQILPRGFHVIYLPFADDVRNFTMSSISKAQTSLVDKAKKIIKALKIKYNDKYYLNPALQKHYSNLQALALERDQVEETKDFINPDPSIIGKANDIIKEFQEEAFPQGYVSSISTGTKRSRDGKDLSEIDWNDLAKTGNIAKLTVTELSTFLKNQGVKVSSKSKKADYVEIATKFILDGKIKTDKLQLLANKSSPTSNQDENNNNHDDDKLYNSKNDDESELSRPIKKVKRDNKSAAPKYTKGLKLDITTPSVIAKDNSDKIDLDPDSIFDDSDTDDESFKSKKSKTSTTSTTTTTTTTSKQPINIFGIDTKNYQKPSTSDPIDNPFISKNKPTNNQKKADVQMDPDEIFDDIQDDGNNDQDIKNIDQDDDDDDVADNSKPICKYDGSCFRKNPDHLKNFRHVKQSKPVA